jgi:hypothetical protein
LSLPILRLHFPSVFPGGAAHSQQPQVCFLLNPEKESLFMTRRQFELELSRATGESISIIRSRGFTPVEPPDLEPLVVNWDEVQAERMGLFPARQRRQAA